MQWEAELSREKLYHYSYEPLSAIGDVKQANVNPRNDHGWYPRGIWFAPGATWKEWSSQFRDDDAFAHRYKVVIGTNALIADLSTPELAVEFTKTFGVMPKDERHGVMGIRWEDVAQCYDGIRIGFKPRYYVHRVPKMLDWCDAWDIPSGCVWRMGDVKLFARGGAVLPHVASHKHWLEGYDEVKREPAFTKATVSAYVGGQWLLIDAEKITMRTVTVENIDGSTFQLEVPMVPA